MKPGLEGVVAAQTVLSHSDAIKARLWVRGKPLEDMVRDWGFEGTVAALWEGFAGDGLSRDRICADLAAGRERAFAGLDPWIDRAAERSPVEGIRLCLAVLPEDSGPADIVGTIAVGLPALLRRQRGEASVAPDPALGTAADLLRMLHGGAVAPAAAKALDVYFTTVAENGLGTSSFAARVVASTRASLASAALGGYCAFMGPLHGGAPGPVLDMLDEAAASGDVDGWIDRKLVVGERLVGFGNRAYPHGDPRADVLGDALRELGVRSARIAFAADFERRALAAFARHRPGRPLRPNLELNAALLLDAVGFPRAAFTPVFAVARSAGWLAHAMEQQRTGRMIRPTAEYVGPELVV